MNEITRIHIAKVPYEIEVGAKKKLEAYITALEAYTEESDWLQDIEIRMTEILEERGVKRNELITSDEVAAIREQLGEPEDFYGEGDIAVGAQQHGDAAPSRRLYRDPSTAMLAGVLSGMAHYLKISPIWTRLAFIVLLFMSFGTVAIVYIVLWIVIPPADSAASQIELKGKAVTLATLKAHRRKTGDTGEVSRAAQITRKVLLYGTGTGAAIAALGSLIFTAWVVFGFAFNSSEGSLFAGYVPATLHGWLGFGLFTLSGVLLAAFFSIVAFICFRRKLKKSVGIAIITVVIAGVVSFGSGIAFTAYDQMERYATLEASRTTKTVQLPESFKGVKSLTIGGLEGSESTDHSGPIGIEYVVSNRAPRYEITRDAETQRITPIVDIDENGGAKVTFKDTQKERWGAGFMQQSTLKIYGPALPRIIVQSGAFSYQASSQSDIAVEVKAGSVTLTGSYGNVAAVAEEGALYASDASIEALTATVRAGQVSAGVVRTFTLTQPDACPAGQDGSLRGVVHVYAVSSGKIIFNGEERDAQSFKHLCGKVVIGDEDEDIEEMHYL